MNDGRIKQVGTPKEVFKSPRNLFVATFIGSLAMNLITGTVRAAGKSAVLQFGGMQSPLHKRVLDVLKPAQEVILGFRRTDIEVSNKIIMGA